MGLLSDSLAASIQARRSSRVAVTTYDIGDDRGYSLCAQHAVEPNTTLRFADDEDPPVELGEIVAHEYGHCHHPACNEPPEP